MNNKHQWKEAVKYNLEEPPFDCIVCGLAAIPHINLDEICESYSFYTGRTGIGKPTQFYTCNEFLMLKANE